MNSLEDLFWMMEAANYDDLPDGAWWQVLEDCVVFWNEKHKTKYDPNDTVHQYLSWRHKHERI